MSALDKLRAEETAMLLIDHQVGTMSWVNSIPFEEMKANALLLARTAQVMKLPAVLTSSMEDHAQGPLLAELEQILPQEFAARIKRAGVVDAMDDPDFAAAVRATGRRKVIVAGVTNDVCTVHPTVTLLREGYEVHVVADAGGSSTQLSDHMSLVRMEQAGAVMTSTMQVITELVGTWASTEGQQLAAAIQTVLNARRQAK
ncbi:isochorismatase [Burkholderia cepacia]|uniref:Isochorismatase family protein n=1 Tax=Burkholderia cenocepacia TaxID=95486 RepID=A0ABD4UIQ9_9BURK|nr:MULTISPECIES: isochorismatase family protein [Burkholderia cepacia complex]KVV23136.1 isochorismatase [Burkholderia cepacia]MCW3698186.1 isochorismatase family protein [Burkholderia cenocepacia]MCW3706039.1 isochorismatase family protein [Burkholderia cenocepacia]MCW3714280.1 isochorismatase family protein [Burkholderia cenocepacia]MCW3722346.1 isochorismatase family protein [Burkholderia cenocepacia]